MTDTANASGKVCLGMITTAHGIKGEVRVRAFTADPRALCDYGALTDERGRVLKLKLRGQPKGEMMVAAIEGITDRNAAEAMRNTRLFVDRAALPVADDGEFYHADLIGLRAETPEGELLGSVVGLQNFGAGDLLEVMPVGKSANRDIVFVSFSDDSVPVVEIAAGRLVMAPGFWLGGAAGEAERDDGLAEESGSQP